MVRKAKYMVVVTCMLAWLSACNEPSSTSEPIAIIDNAQCQPHNELRSLCGLHAPQDLAALPDQSGLVISEFGYANEQGRLSFFDIGSGLVQVAYDSDSSNDMTTNNAIWGDIDCEEPDMFLPVGIDVAQRPSGRWQLIVINRASPQTVEFFELIKKDRDDVVQKNGYSIEWRGCTAVEKNVTLNELAATYNGFLAIENRSNRGFWPQWFNRWLKPKNSWLRQWSFQQGWSVVKAYKDVALGGIAYTGASPRYYVSLTNKNKVKALSTVLNKKLFEFSVNNVMHTNWADKARAQLLAVVQLASNYHIDRCIKQPEKQCSNAFNVVNLNIKTGKLTTLLHMDDGYFGGASAAVQLGQTLYIGAFSGDRLLIAPVGYGLER